MNPATHHALFAGISLNIIISLVVSAIYAKLFPQIAAIGTTSGNTVGQVIVNAVTADVDPALRAIVIAELQAIANDVTAKSQTVVQTAQAILAKILPSVPTASVAQIASILGEFVKTFEAGLSAELSAANSSSLSSSSAAVAPQSEEKKAG